MPELNQNTPSPEVPQRRNSVSNAADAKATQSVNQYTRAVRRKLYFLFAMLVLVIILMKEARKPENWMWMGFKNAATGTAEAFELDGRTDPNSDSQLDGDQSAGSLPVSETNQSTNVETGDSRGTKFWHGLWENLEIEDRTALVELIQLSQKRVDQRDINLADFDPLASAIKHNTPGDELYDEVWESTIQPGLLAVAEGEDLTIKQQVAIKDLFKTLDPLILGSLDDFTSPGRKTDMPAWFRYWGRILEKEKPESVSTVSPVQLVAQPDVWRFQPIRIKGRLLAGRAKAAGIHGPLRQQGVWYEWWIGNAHGANEVWCIYTAEKPDSVEVSEKFSNFDVPVECSGLFYKVRSYVDAESKGNHCPLILANGLNVTRRSNPVSKASWLPSPTIMIACIVGVMLFAFALAMMIYRSDKQRIHQPAGEHKRLIDDHLDSLADDPNIKSIAERLEELE